MIQHVLTPKLTQIKDRYEQQLHEKLYSIEESAADFSEEIDTNDEESKDLAAVDEFISRIGKDTIEGQSIEDKLKMAEEYLSKCDQDGNYVG